MSLLGRLEDLSLTDIVQIVFLSRRTGILEIIDSRGRHAVIFRQGLIVNASSPDHPDLATRLLSSGAIDHAQFERLRAAEMLGTPIGNAILDLGLVATEELAESIRQHIVAVTAPLLSSRDGEFNFILSDSVSPLDTGYDPQRVFKEGGIAPAKILGGGEGDKLKPLAGLEESMKAGKALLRGAAPSSPEPSPSPSASPFDGGAIAVRPSHSHDEVPLFDTPDFDDAAGLAPFADLPEEEPQPAAAGAMPSLTELAAEITAESAFPEADLSSSTAARPSTSPASFTFEPEVAGESERRVVFYQKEPLLRVAARRAFGRRRMETLQFGSIADARNAVQELLARNRFFVTFLDYAHEDAGRDTIQLLEQIKERNHHLPVVIVDRMADLRRRHDLLAKGADLYLTKPSEAHLQPGMAEEQLALFADELVLFAERSFSQWGSGAAEAHESYQAAEKERAERSSQLLKHLINELSNPNDITQVSSTILRFAAQYLDRAVLFAAATAQFVGLAGFGPSGNDGDMTERARTIRIGRAEPSILQDVASRGAAHRGKLRKSTGNVRLVGSLGTLLPTEVVVVPILNREEVVGVLYGDNAENRAPIADTAGLEIFLGQAGFALQNALIANAGRFGLE